jgi:hypothetical protein
MTLTRIGHLETVIRVPDATAASSERLRWIAEERLPGALGGPVGRALAEFGEVVVLRHVDLALSIVAPSSTGAEELTDRWARAVGDAVADVAARGDRRDIVRFADEATFVSSFVRDLLAGRAWETWCYGAFRPLREIPVGAAIARVLGEHAHVLAAILRLLGRDDALQQALSALPEEGAEQVWRSALTQGPRPLDGASALPIAAAALHIARRLRILAEPAPEPAELATGHRRWFPDPVDWSTARSLADAVCAALEELARAGFLRPDATAGREDVAIAVTDLDWLDRERLADAIVALLDPADTSGARDDVDVELATLGTAIEAAARSAGLWPPAPADDPAAAAVRLLAALAERDPVLAARADAPFEIQRFLSRSTRAVAADRAGDATASSRAARPDAGPSWHRCEAAGVLLLTRAFADLRFGALASRLGLPSPGLADDSSAALLLSVALAVAGPDGVARDGRLDPGLVALLGREDAVSAVELAAAWSATDASGHRLLRAELDELAAGQRLDQPRPLPECCHPALPGLACGSTARAAHLAILAWARWLPGLSGSTPQYVLAQLLRRGGSVSVSADTVRVALDPRPLDVVAELAGYLAPSGAVPWTDERAVLITRGEAS